MALTTISLANSMPGALQAELAGCVSREKPRRPQWKSPTGIWKNSRPMKRQHRIAQIAVQARHGAGRDPALEAVAHDQVGAVAQLVDNAVEVSKS